MIEWVCSLTYFHWLSVFISGIVLLSLRSLWRLEKANRQTVHDIKDVLHVVKNWATLGCKKEETTQKAADKVTEAATVIQSAVAPFIESKNRDGNPGIVAGGTG